MSSHGATLLEMTARNLVRLTSQTILSQFNGYMRQLYAQKYPPYTVQTQAAGLTVVRRDLDERLELLDAVVSRLAQMIASETDPKSFSAALETLRLSRGIQF